MVEKDMLVSLLLAGGLIALTVFVLKQTPRGQVYYGGNPGDQSFNIQGEW